MVADGVRSLVTGLSVSGRWFVSLLDLFHMFSLSFTGWVWALKLIRLVLGKDVAIWVKMGCSTMGNVWSMTSWEWHSYVTNPVYIATEKDHVHSWDMPMALSFMLETPSVVNCVFFNMELQNYMKTSLNFNLISCYKSVLEALLTLTSAVPLLSTRCHTSSTVYMLISNL